MKAMAMETVLLKVRGMECDACVGHVSRALKAVAGVTQAEVDLPREEARVIYDASLASLSDLAHAVEEEGYAAEPVSA